MNEVECVESDVELGEAEETSRREFFDKFGKFALYTTPAVMLLMSTQAEAISMCSVPGSGTGTTGSGSGNFGHRRRRRRKFKRKTWRRHDRK